MESIRKTWNAITGMKIEGPCEKESELKSWTRPSGQLLARKQEISPIAERHWILPTALRRSEADSSPERPDESPAWSTPGFQSLRPWAGNPTMLRSDFWLIELWLINDYGLNLYVCGDLLHRYGGEIYIYIYIYRETPFLSPNARESARGVNCFLISFVHSSFLLSLLLLTCLHYCYWK